MATNRIVRPVRYNVRDSRRRVHEEGNACHVKNLARLVSETRGGAYDGARSSCAIYHRSNDVRQMERTGDKSREVRAVSRGVHWRTGVRIKAFEVQMTPRCA